MKLIRVLGIILMILFSLTGCGTDLEKNSQNSISNVKVIKVIQGTLNKNITVTGKLEAVESANVVSKMLGKVEKITVDVGSNVSAGELLINLDAKDLMANITKSEADVAFAQTGIASAQVTYQIARNNYAKGLNLFKVQAISDYDFENNYEKPYKIAEASLNTAKAQVVVYQAALNENKVSFEDSKIFAPISGIVTAKNINLGEMASTTMPVLNIMNLDKVKVKAMVTEDQVNFLKEGQQTKVKVDAIPGKDFIGVISHISPAEDLQNKAYPIMVQIDNGKHILKPGMFSQVQIPIQKFNGIVIPKESVLSDNGTSFAFILNNKIAKKVAVTVVITDDKNALITKGLVSGDEVITSNVAAIKDGTKINN